MSQPHLHSTQAPPRQRGDVIRELRRGRGQKVGDLALACGFRRAQSLTNIENQSVQASWEALYAIARELNVPIRTVLRDPDEKAPAEPQPTASPEIHEGPAETAA